jgi:hypothetical protein
MWLILTTEEHLRRIAQRIIVVTSRHKTMNENILIKFEHGIMVVARSICTQAR